MLKMILDPMGGILYVAKIYVLDRGLIILSGSPMMEMPFCAKSMSHIQQPKT